MTRYYQLLLKNDRIGYCKVVGQHDVMMTHEEVCKFKWTHEPHSHKDYYYETVEVKDVENYKILPPYKKVNK